MNGAVLLAADDPLSHVTPHPLLRVGEFSVANTFVMLLLAALLMLIVFPIAARSSGAVPRGLRNLVESVMQFLREQVARPSLHEATDRFMPFLWTVFFLILFANILGALPIAPVVSLITGRESHIGGTATGDISITVGLALCAFLAIHVGGIREQGFGPYFKNFVPHAPLPIQIVLVPLEILGAAVKPFAL